MSNQENIFSDAARFKVLSELLLQGNFNHFPNRNEITRAVHRNPVLRAWIRDQQPQRFMRDAKFFYYRERKRRSARA